MNKRIKNPGKFWDKAWSLVDGCTPVSAGCDNCWLEKMTRFDGRDFSKVTFREDRLDIPLRARKPTVFAIWSDLYHPSVLLSQVLAAFTVMESCPHHTFLIVTKRPEAPAEHRRFLPDLPNVYHLITVENQEMADKRIPHALQIPGTVGLLIEPMLGPINFSHCYAPNGAFVIPNGISCVLLGGETGPKARPMHPDWARSVRDQCHMAGVPFFFKSNGEWMHESQNDFDASPLAGASYNNAMFVSWPEASGRSRSYRVGSKRAGRLLDGREHNDLPWRAK